MSAAPLTAAVELPADPLAWTMEQLLERVPVSRSTVYRWIEREGLPVVRVGKSSSPLFRPESVLAWLQSREQQKAQAAAQTNVDADARLDTLRLAEERQTTRRPPRSRRTPPPPLAVAGSRERLRRLRGAH